MLALATEDPPALQLLNPAVPKELARLINQLLAKKPEERPASTRLVAQTLADIERWLTEAVVPPGTWVPLAGKTMGGTGGSFIDRAGARPSALDRAGAGPRPSAADRSAAAPKPPSPVSVDAQTPLPPALADAGINRLTPGCSPNTPGPDDLVQTHSLSDAAALLGELPKPLSPASVTRTITKLNVLPCPRCGASRAGSPLDGWCPACGHHEDLAKKPARTQARLAPEPERPRPEWSVRTALTVLGLVLVFSGPLVVAYRAKHAGHDGRAATVEAAANDFARMLSDAEEMPDLAGDDHDRNLDQDVDESR
jgi:hypothetical protein